MRAALILLPLALGAVVLAQDKAQEKQQEEVVVLILKLGHEEYAVREAATAKLIELGEKAVPALEDALKSSDLEVRMRAGRALRAIRTKEGVPWTTMCRAFQCATPAWIASIRGRA